MFVIFLYLTVILLVGFILHVDIVKYYVLDYVHLPIEFIGRFEVHIYGFMSILIFIRMLKQGKKNRLLKKFKKSGAIKKISWQEFEELTGQLYRSRGYNAEVKGGSGGDGGIDVIIKKNGKIWIVQCKHWQTKKVGISIVREMYGVMIDQQVYGAKIVTSGGFTKQCFEFVKGKQIELIDGKKLLSISRS